jgi:quercetin dioxygenase-like cupin family protein
MDEPLMAVMRKGEVPREAYPGGEINWLTSRKTNGARELTFGHTVIDIGKCNPLHRHPNCEEVLYVLSGEIEHYIEGTPRERMVAGDTILVPRNLIHQAVNVGEGLANLLVAFSSAERETVIIEP